MTLSSIHSGHVRFGELDSISRVGLDTYQAALAESGPRYKAHLQDQLTLIADTGQREQVAQAVETARLLNDFYTTVDADGFPHSSKAGWEGHTDTSNYMNTSTMLQRAMGDAAKKLGLPGVLSALRKLDEVPEKIKIHVVSPLTYRLRDLAKAEGLVEG